MESPGPRRDTEDIETDRINPIVFYISAISIAVFALWAMITPDVAGAVINAALAWISNTFGWLYFLAVVIYLVFVIGIGVSRFGNIRLGPDESRPEFPLLTWAAMLFAAGIGIDLLFFSVHEPLSHFLSPPVGEGGTVEAARRAMQLTFLHWGISGWGIYTLVGMSLAYFSYRHGLPLNFRSALYPLIGQRIYGWIGHIVDIAAVAGTVFGIATSLGIGIIQLNFGLNYMFGIPEHVVTQSALATLIVIFAAVSAASGVERGIRRLSEFNMSLALLLALFVLFAGETLFLLDALVMNLGNYITNYISMSFNTYAYDPPRDWLNGWTIFFWAWWIAWGPFVGIFLARISRGRTIRQFVAGTLTIPLAFMVFWMSTMGTSAIEQVTAGATEFGESAVADPGSAIYLFMENLPWTYLTTIVVSILAIVFFVTSGDSGSLVLANLTSYLKDPNSDAPTWMRVLWAAIIGAVTLGLLIVGGLTALQSAVVIMGLPFSIVLFLTMIGIFRALRVEALKEDSHRTSLAGYLSGRSEEGWRRRLARTTNFPTRQEAETLLRERVKPAMNEISSVLEERGFPCRLETETEDKFYVLLEVAIEGQQDFSYAIRPVRQTMPAFVRRPQQAAATYYRLEVYLAEGSQGYDIAGYTKEQIIEDVLDQFERHMDFLHRQRDLEGGNVPMPTENPATE